MSSAWTQLITELHALSHPTVVVVTGGVASAIAQLLAVPGASRTILDARVPYSANALDEWLGRRPEQYCDERAALAMASVACDRARKLSTDQGSIGQPTFGVSCTASLASDRPKRGDHRCFIAIQSPSLTVSVSLTLQKGARTRAEEEAIVSHLIVGSFAEACGLTGIPPLDLFPDEQVQREVQMADSVLSAVWTGESSCIWSVPGGLLTARLPQQPVGILCGAFDPLHHGHEDLRKFAEQRLQGPVAYELSVTNVDKPPLDFLTLHRRRQQFVREPLALTNAPRFWQKSHVFPGTTFVVGSDTAVRIVDAKYYAGDHAALESALATIRNNGCRFLVASRVIDGQLVTFNSEMAPSSARDLFEAIPEDEFRVDISSTELRKHSAETKFGNTAS